MSGIERTGIEKRVIAFRNSIAPGYCIPHSKEIWMLMNDVIVELELLRAKRNLAAIQLDARGHL